MSLEQALNENTAAVRELIATLLAKAGTVDLAPVVEQPKPAVRFWHDEQHRTVYSLAAEHTAPAGTVEIDAGTYATLKAQYDAITKQLLDAKTAGNVVATPSPAPGPAVVAETPAPAAEPSTPAPAEQPASYDFQTQVLPKLMDLAKKPSDASASLKALLKQFGVNLVPELKKKCADDGFVSLVAGIAHWTAAPTEQAAAFVKGA